VVGRHKKRENGTLSETNTDRRKTYKKEEHRKKNGWSGSKKLSVAPLGMDASK